MEIRKGILIFDGDKEKLEKFGCIVEITKTSDKGVLIADVMIPKELWDQLHPIKQTYGGGIETL